MIGSLLSLNSTTSVRMFTFSPRHQFGYGKDMFFWSFIVATMLFGVSGVLSIEHGVSSLVDPHTIENATISYVVLAIAFAFEANALRIAYVLFKQTIEARGEKVNMRTLVVEFKESKDPTIITVMVEDAAALLGIVIAGVGILLSDVTGNPFFDAASSLAIGALLMAFAFFLARENRGLLLGESISGDESRRIRELVKTVPEVRDLVQMRTMHLGTHDVIVSIEVSLVDGLDTGRVAAATDEIEQRVRQVLPYAKQEHIFIEVEKHGSLP